MKKTPSQKKERKEEGNDEIVVPTDQKIHEPDLPLLQYDDFGMEDPRVKMLFPKRYP